MQSRGERTPYPATPVGRLGQESGLDQAPGCLEGVIVGCRNQQVHRMLMLNVFLKLSI